MSDNRYPETFDPLAQEWSLWPLPNAQDSGYGCLVSWKYSLILFAKQSIEIFDVSTQTWTTQDPPSPISIYGGGCAVLPNEEIIFVGSCNEGSQQASFLYNVPKNRWTQVGDSSFGKCSTAVVVLGSRVFAIGGKDEPSVVEEFLYASKTWKPIETEVWVPRTLHSAIPVPAKLFSHLQGGCEGF